MIERAPDVKMEFKTETPKTIEWYEERHLRTRKKIGNLRRSYRQLQKAHERVGNAFTIAVSRIGEHARERQALIQEINELSKDKSTVDFPRIPPFFRILWTVVGITIGIISTRAFLLHHL